MHALQALLQQQSRNPNLSALPDLESTFADDTSRAAAVYSDEVPLLATRLRGMRDADKFCLPMTVYRNESSSRWAYTNPLAPQLKKAEVFVTMLSGPLFQ